MLDDCMDPVHEPIDSRILSIRMSIRCINRTKK